MSLAYVQDDRITAAVLLPSLQHFVYELVCNSLEANATSIQITISKENLICKDNGYGIKDMSLISTQGATSKLNHRGAALSAMNTLCHLQITSKCAKDKLGQRWDQNGTITQCAFNNGTQVQLSNIYHNLAVRSKYLVQHFNKEITKCIDLVQSFATLYPIEWIFDKYHNNKPQRVLTFKNESNLLNRLNVIFKDMQPVQLDQANGFISTLDIKESKLCITYNSEPLLLNFEKHKNLVVFKKLLKEVYKSHGIHKYAVILKITNNNQFLTEATVKHIVSLISNKLTQLQTVHASTSFQSQYSQPLLSQSILSSDTVLSATSVPNENKDVRIFGPTVLAKSFQPTINILNQMSIPHNPIAKCCLFNAVECADTVNHDLQISDFHKMTIIGQFNLGFILCSLATNAISKLYIVDQHASDEIYNYENLLKSMKITKYPLLLPKLISLNPSESLVFQKHEEYFKSFGYEFMVDNDGDVYMIVIPAYNGVEMNENDLFDLMAQLENGHGRAIPVKLKNKMASRACRSSIMIGDALQKQEMAIIVRHLGDLEKPWHCPHGRPTVKLLKGFKMN